MLKKGVRSDVYIDGTKIQYVNFFNYLGIKIDSTLTFEALFVIQDQKVYYYWASTYNI